MKLSKYILASLILSLVLHLFILYVLSGIGILPPLMASEDEHTFYPVEVVLRQILPEIDTKEKEEQESDEGESKKGMEQAKKMLDKGYAEPSIAELFDEEKLIAPLPQPTVKYAGLDTAEIKPDIPSPKTEILASAPRPEIIQIDAAKLPANSNLDRKMIAKVERMDVSDLKLPSLLPHGPSISGEGASYNVRMIFSPTSFGGPGSVPDDAIGTPGNVSDGLGGQLLMPSDPNADLSKLNPDSGKIVSFEDYVDVKVDVMEDSMSGGGFFRAVITANEKCDTIREIPKDVIMIIDRSSSISPKKFSAFKKAAVNSLDYLNSRDRFNVVTFTDKALAFSKECVGADSKNRNNARDFIEHIVRGGTTSVFDGLNPFVQNTNRSSRPLNIFLLTDGISTVNIYRDDEFLRNITGINPGHISIFPFCAGRDANRELLDFLGFLNRGQSLHVASLDDVDNRLTQFIVNHSSLLIRDIEYMAPNSLVREIYPKKLQHLYRGAAVEIYGCYGPGDSELVLRVIGYDSGDVRRDVMFRKKISECDKTTDPIDKLWAAKKIIHLLSDKTLTVSAAEKKKYDNEINNLKNRFNLAVPY